MKNSKMLAIVVLALALMVWPASVAEGRQSLTVNGKDVTSITLELGQTCTVEVVSTDGTSYTDYVGFYTGTPVLGDFSHLETKPEAGGDATVTEYNQKPFYGYRVTASGKIHPPSHGVHFIFQYEAQKVGETDVVLAELIKDKFVVIDSVHITVIPLQPVAIGTAFTYQGRLIDANDVADGLYDFQFELYDNADPVFASQQGNTIDINDLDVIDGYFTVELDFGSDVFNGDARWLEISVRPGEPNDPCEYTFLSPLVELTPTPYAIYAETAGGGGDSDWIISGDDMYSGVSGNVGIGTTNPTEKLHVDGNARITGSLIVEGDISGSIDFSQITGLLGSGYSVVFPDVIDNLTTLEIEGIETYDPAVIVHGPGYDIERIEGYDGQGRHNDQPGLSMEHPLIFECSGTDADNVQAYFDSYFANPYPLSPPRSGSIVIFDLSSTEAMRWNFFEFIPQTSEPGVDGRTRFTMVNRFLPNTNTHWQQGSADAFGNQLSNNPLTDTLVEIAGVTTFYPEVEVDDPNRTLTLTYDFVEGFQIWDWVIDTIKGIGEKKDMSVIQEEGGIEVSRNNYFGGFPIKYEQVTGFGLDTKIKARVVLSFDFWEVGL